MILKQKNHNESLQNYTATISHELRTPISTILMMVESFKPQITDPEHLRIISLIIAQLNLVLCIVQDMLDLKMIESQTF